ncbi:MAG: glycosyltransferase family 2 protein, partial [Gammaproteobacteria bacterium]|nr:glycosyltransferase family 2 protein [Gammaproteobacteria bacterium]
IGEIRAALDGQCDYEIVYVDDGSSDRTLERLVALSGGLPRLRILHHRRCCGQSTALATGIRASRGGIVATLDGDGQNDPADIPKLYARLTASAGSQGLAMVAGYRAKRQDTPWRRFSSKLANAVRAALLGDRTPDTGCGLKVFPRDVFLALPYFDHMHRFLPALVQRAGGGVVSVEVNHRPRLRGLSKYGTWHRLWVGIIDLCGVMWLQRRAHVPEIEVRSRQ